jgi:hypothetical protein
MRLVFRDGQVSAATAACLATEQLDGVSAERPSLAGREQGLVGLALAFFEPLAQDRDGLPSQGGGPLLASLGLGDADVSAGAQADVRYS